MHQSPSHTGVPDEPEEQQHILWETVNQTGDRFSQQEQEQLLALLLQYSDLFANGPDDPTQH